MFSHNTSSDCLRTTSACADLVELFKNNLHSTSINFQEVDIMSSDDIIVSNIESVDYSYPPITAHKTFEKHQEVAQIEIKNDILLDSLEPKPISGYIQRVRQLPLTSFLSDDLRRNCDEYCTALQSLTNDGSTDSILLRPSSIPAFSVKSFSVGYPKPGVTRSNSESSAVSLVSTASVDSSDVIHIYDYQQERWMDRYQQLSAFFQKHGHTDVPNEFDLNLARWVRRQRHQFKRAKQGRRSTLTVNRVHLLEQVGFKWDKHSLAWFENFERLKLFHKIHKHCNIPTSHSCTTFFGTKEEHDRLLNWCKRQKRAIRMYLKNKDAVGSRMDVKRFELLQSIGFRWQPAKQDESR